MNAFMNMRVSTKLFLSFGIVLLLTAALAFFAVMRFSHLAGNAKDISSNWMPSIDHLSSLNTLAGDVRIAELMAVSANTPAEMERQLQAVDRALEQFSREIPEYAKLVSSEEEKRLFVEWQENWKKYQDLHSRGESLLRDKRAEEGEAMWVGEGREVFDNFGDLMDKAIALNREGAMNASASADATYRSSRALIFLVLLVAIAVGGTVTVVVSRSLAGPLAQIIGVFRSMAGGKLDNSIATTRRDEIGTVFESLGQMQENLRKLMAENTGQLDAINKSQARIEFEVDGTVVAANDNFLRTIGYSIDELRGRHHSQLVSLAERSSPEYERFWEKLRRGEYDKGRYLRLAKGDREVWIDAAYNPILDADGKPYKIVKYANDVTEQVLSARQIEKAVLDTQAAIKSANEGDLTARVPSQDKTGNLRAMAEAINSLLAGMADIVSQVKVAASDVHRGADEISQGNTNLSQRTEEQSSSLEETASSMEEMTSTVKQNADNAGQANQLATAARDQAEKGGAVTAKAVRAMTEINESSKKIADIIGVIDEIAFQTNLLALNAAVEAARAGEQGRGFAVVASEVRSLAGRSATAAKEIKNLIQDSVKKVEDGSVLVTQSGQTLEQIVSSVKKVSDIVAEIAAASREQSSGIEQVNKAVMQMDEMTQQNAALVEEASAASHSMAEQARTLNEMMSRYRLATDAASRSADLSVSTPVSASPSANSNAPRVERRKADRAWSGRKGSHQPSRIAKAEFTAAAQVSGDDSEWKEF